jgi:hypothetical protein
LFLVAKVSELIEQARALEAAGDSAKALAIYQHLLPHLDAMPAIKADLSLKAGDLMLKLGNKAGALGMYDQAGAQCAVHGSTKGILTVAAKIQAAAPERTDTLLSLAAQLVQRGHAKGAVDVLIHHAKQANLPEMLQELEPLQGRSSEDVKPMVQMLLDQPASPPSAPAAPPPPAEEPPPARKSQQDMDGILTPLSLDEQLASMAPPSAPSASVPTMQFEAIRPPEPRPEPRPEPPPFAPPQFTAPPAPPPPPPVMPPSPQFAAPPPPPPQTVQGFTPGAPPEMAGEIHLDVSPPLPPTPRETAAINMRASQSLKDLQQEEEAPRRRPSQQVRMSGARTAPVERKPVGLGVLLLVPVVLALVVAGLYYFQFLPDSVSQQISALISRKGPAATADSAAIDSVTPPVAVTGADSGGVTPEPPPAVAAAPVTEAPHAPRPAAAAPGGNQPPVRIEGLTVVDFRETGDRFQVVQRQESGQYLTLTGRPLADTVGEPVAGDIKLDSLPGDTAVAVTSFEGYVITVKGVAAPEALRTLLLQLVSRSAN